MARHAYIPAITPFRSATAGLGTDGRAVRPSNFPPVLSDPHDLTSGVVSIPPTRTRPFDPRHRAEGITKRREMIVHEAAVVWSRK